RRSEARSRGRRSRPRGLRAPGAEERVRRGERLVQAARILPARLREVGTSTAAAADQRRELLDDVTRVVAADEVLRHRGEEEGTSARGGAQDDDAGLDPVARSVRHLAEPAVVEPLDPRREDRDAVDPAGVGEDVAACAAGELSLQLGDPLLELALLREKPL